MPLLGRPMLCHQLERISSSKYIDQIVVATSHLAADDAIESLCKDHQIACYRGSLNDVLDRYYQCASGQHVDHVVRLTGDCPLADAHIIDEVIKLHLKQKADYTANINPPSFPDGLDVEVMTFSALETAWENASLVSEREHVTLYIRNHPELFKIENLVHQQDVSHLRWTVDEQRDFSLIENIYQALYTENSSFGFQEVLHLLREQPQLIAINGSIERDEGLKKSLANDSVVPSGRPS